MSTKERNKFLFHWDSHMDKVTPSFSKAIREILWEKALAGRRVFIDRKTNVDGISYFAYERLM